MTDMNKGQSLTTDNKTSKRKGLGLKAIISSTLAGAIGVQSQKNYERDFEQGNIWIFIVSGVVFTALFIATIVTVVNMVLPD